MKVIYTGAFRFPDKDAASQRVLNNGKILKKLGYDVSFLGWENKEREEDLNAEKKYVYEGFEYNSMNELDIINTSVLSKISNYYQRGNKTLKYIENNYKNINIIIIYNSNYLFVNRMIKFCRINKIKLIIDSTEWYESEHLPGGKYGIPSIDNFLRMKVANVKAQNVIVISTFLKKFYDSNACKTLLLPPLIDIKEKKWQITNNIRSYNDDIKIIYAGDPGRKDILGDVIKTVEIFNKTSQKKITFNILGIDENKLLNILQMYKLPDNVNCLGRVEMHLVPKFYSENHFSILIREDKRYAHAGFSTKFVESLCSGIPVIANCTSDISTYIEDGNNGFILEDGSIGNILKMFTKLENLSPSQYQDLSSNAKLSGVQYFDFNNYIITTNLFFKGLL